MRVQLGPIRRRVRGVMTARCRVVTLGGWVYDPATGQEVQAETELYAGPCWMRPADRDEKVIRTGGQSLELTQFEVWLTPDAPPMPKDAALYFTGSLGDPALIGVRMTVTSAALDDWQVARRLICQRAE
ncbi:DUF6093 family protein [Mariniluteicoccus flavus]